VHVTEETLAPVSGDEAPADAYAELFRAQFRAMTHLARLVGADDPENVAQEAFVRLESRRRTLRDPNAAIGYLRTSVINLSRSRLRHLAVVRSARLPVDNGESSEWHALVRDEQSRVRAALLTLPRRQREVIVLRYWLDMSEAEIAHTLGIGKGSVKAYASRGLDALGTAMGER